MNKKHLLLGLGLLSFWLCSSTFLRTNLGSSVRYFNDDADRLVYFARGIWLPEGKIPYLDVFSEYPQVPTYLFGVIFLLISREVNIGVAYTVYTAIFSLLMIYILIALLLLVEKELPDEKKKWFLFLCLPAPLYFTLNRFDVLASFISLLALIMVKHKNWGLAGCLLGIGALTKWYPVLLVPLVAVYMFHTSVSWKKILQFFLLFGLTCLIILLPTFISGGFRAVWVPYAYFQNNRGYDPAAILALTLPLIQSVMPFAKADVVKYVFALMQFGAVPVLCFVRIDTFGKLLNCCLIAVTIFIMFASIYSPQWVLWIFPLMILLARSKWDVALLVAYGVLTYVEFPIVYDCFGAASFEMRTMGWLNIALLILIVIQPIRRLYSSSRLQVTLPDRIPVDA